MVIGDVAHFGGFYRRLLSILWTLDVVRPSCALLERSVNCIGAVLCHFRFGLLAKLALSAVAELWDGFMS